MEPFEIVAAPLELFLAPVGTAFPAPDEAPGAGWVMVGTSGDKNYTEDGVAVAHEQTLEKFRPVGGTGARKVWRTEEMVTFTLTLADISADQYAQALNDAEVTTTAPAAGVPGTDAFDLQQGLDVAEFALLARGKSPADDAFAAQYEVPRCFQSGNPSPVYKKGEPAGLELTFEALEDDSAGFGELVIQTAVAV